LRLGKRIRGGYANNSAKANLENEINGIEVTGFPNPSNTQFSLVVNSVK
jgi:hypothetical protein